MDEIYRMHLTVTGAYAFHAKVEYMNPGESKWKRSGNLAKVSVGISKEVYLKDVSGIKDGALVRFVMEIVLGKTVAASEQFTYRESSDYYASYNGTGTALIKPKAVYKGRFSTAVYSGEVSALSLKVTGLYAYKAKIQYRKASNTAWKTTGHLADVSVGFPKMLNICDVREISAGDQFRFVMDIVAGNKNVNANEYFIYKNDATSIAKYDCKGVLLNPNIKFNGVTAYTPIDFVCDLEKIEEQRNFSIYSANATGLSEGGCVRIKNHSLANLMKFENGARIASIFAEKKGNKTRITARASNAKNSGVGHIWLIDKDYNYYEEDLLPIISQIKDPFIDCNGNANITYVSWNDKALGGDPPFLKALRSITIKGEHQELFRAWGFESREHNGRLFYNTMVDCFQRKYGYCDLYDDVFDYATTAMWKKFPFISQGQQYVFWVWKGNYLNLGAGAEMGFYKFKETLSFNALKAKLVDGVCDFIKKYNLFKQPLSVVLPFTETTAKLALDTALTKIRKKTSYDYYEADESLYMPMKLILRGKGRLPQVIHTYEPKEKQWWITSFAPYLQGVNPKDLAPEFTVCFDQAHKQLFEDFIKKYPASGWKYDRKTLTLVYTF